MTATSAIAAPLDDIRLALLNLAILSGRDRLDPLSLAQAVVLIGERCNEIERLADPAFVDLPLVTLAEVAKLASPRPALQLVQGGRQ